MGFKCQQAGKGELHFSFNKTTSSCAPEPLAGEGTRASLVPNNNFRKLYQMCLKKGKKTIALCWAGPAACVVPEKSRELACSGNKDLCVQKGNALCSVTDGFELISQGSSSQII